MLEDGLGAIFGHSPVAFFLVDFDGIFIDVNEAAAKLVCYSRKELIGKKLAELNIITPNQFTKLESSIYNWKKGQPSGPNEYILNRKDRSQIFVESWSFPVKSGDQNLALTMIIDLTDRVRAEEALKKSEKKYRTLVEHIPQKIFIKDRRSVYISSNENYARDLKLKPDEIGGKTDYDFYPKELAKKYRKDDRRIIDSGETEEIEEHYIQGGRNVWVHTIKTPLKDENENIIGLLGIFWDITKRKEAEEELRESEEKLRVLFEQLPIGVSLLDQNREMIYVNPALEKILAISRDDLLKGKYQNRRYIRADGTSMPPEEYASVRAFQKQQPVHDVETGVITESGKTIWTSVSAAPFPVAGKGVVITTVGITERKQAEEALKKSEEYFRALTENSSDIIIILDKKGTITYMSPSIERFCGYKPEELIGKNGFDFIKPVDLPRAIYDFGKAILTKETVISNTFRVRHKDGSERILDGLGKNLLDNPAIAGFVMNTRDITERKRMEDERTRMLADLEAKNEEMEAFVYTVSHDLKSPLVSLGGFSSVLQKEYESQLGEEGKHYLERIQANIAYMGALITSLLEVSRLGQVVGPIKEIDVAALLREIRDALAIRLKEVGAEFVVQEPLPIVRADRDRIHQVFVNLIVNAVKFRGTERVLRIEVGCRQESGFYRFHVADNGIGIAPQYHEQIFVPFRKLHSEIEGMGIGLSLVKKIVENHGGRVWVESPSTSLSAGNEGAGATFYFTLPMERRTNSLS
jgi:PAS domain S-box-containing protein